jgi:uncharacterized protein YidB (DUF937 family)
MGMLDDLLGAALGGQGLGGGAASRDSALPAGLNAGTLAALLPVVLAMLSQGQGGRQSGNFGGGLGGLLGQMLGGGAGSHAGLGGLGGLLQQLEQAGLGAHAQSWVGAGQNRPISPDAIGKVFGQDGIADIARRAGLSQEQASAGLAHLLPAVVDHVTPSGQLPTGAELDESLAGLMKRLGG